MRVTHEVCGGLQTEKTERGQGDGIDLSYAAGVICKIILIKWEADLAADYSHLSIAAGRAPTRLN